MNRFLMISLIISGRYQIRFQRFSWFILFFFDQKGQVQISPGEPVCCVLTFSVIDFRQSHLANRCTLGSSVSRIILGPATFFTLDIDVVKNALFAKVSFWKSTRMRHLIACRAQKFYHSYSTYWPMSNIKISEKYCAVHTQHVSKVDHFSVSGEIAYFY